LPTGETSFFQAGTEDLVAEWVLTCNYWAARTSRQPLQGGVSNMEYGWSRVDQDDDHDRSSVLSGRSNLSRLKTYRTLPASEKWHINDWKPPPAATMPSPLDEESQLEALQSYVKSLRHELDQHKALEDGMNRLVCLQRNELMKVYTPLDQRRESSRKLEGQISVYPDRAVQV